MQDSFILAQGWKTLWKFYILDNLIFFCHFIVCVDRVDWYCPTKCPARAVQTIWNSWCPLFRQIFWVIKITTKHKKHQQTKAKSKPKAANPHLFLKPANDPSCSPDWSAGPAPRAAVSGIMLRGGLVLCCCTGLSGSQEVPGRIGTFLHIFKIKGHFQGILHSHNNILSLNLRASIHFLQTSTRQLCGNQ